MKKSTRIKEATDYKKFNTTGIKEIKKKVSEEEDVIGELSKSLESVTMAKGGVSDNENGESKEVSMSEEEKPDVATIRRKMLEKSNLADEIDDFMDENDMECIRHDVQEAEKYINKLEQLRQEYRSLHKELSQYIQIDEQDDEAYSLRLQSMKKYIIDVKRLKTQYKTVEKERKTEDQTTRFLVNKVQHIIACCKEMHSDQFKEEKDDTIIRRKEELKQNTQTMQELTSTMQKIVKSNVSTVESKSDTQKLIKEQEKFEKQHQKYVNQLKHEANTREVEKYKVFQQSQLNIKFEKFQGCNSSLDIYTFKSEFEKLHLNSTPRKLLPDLLKNNFLTNRAYALVQCVEDIDQIWTRLIAAYGDTRHMLNSKLHSINKLEAMWKLKQPEKVTNALVKVVNLMKDLMKLSEEHNIEEKLYHGEGLQQIYKQLGDGRVTRWLLTICNEQLEYKKVLEKLILFLEKEVKIQQQRILISSRSTTELKIEEDVMDFILYIQMKKSSTQNASFVVKMITSKLKVQEKHNWFSIFHVRNLQK